MAYFPLTLIRHEEQYNIWQQIELIRYLLCVSISITECLQFRWCSFWDSRGHAVFWKKQNNKYLLRFILIVILFHLQLGCSHIESLIDNSTIPPSGWITTNTSLSSHERCMDGRSHNCSFSRDTPKARMIPCVIPRIPPYAR